MSDGQQDKRQQQNDLLEAMFRQWQLAWHDAFDQDELLAKHAELERPDPLPEEIDVDHRLIHEFCNTQVETRQACFALFPNGAEMHRRLEAYLIGTPINITPDEARNLVLGIGQNILEVGPEEYVDCSKVTVVNCPRQQADDGLPYRDIRHLFETGALAPDPGEHLAAVGAWLFLTEPLYAAAGNFYHLRDWITAAMFDRNLDRIFEVNYRLWRAGWGLYHAQGELFLFRNA